jgi:hypothetical protein
LTYKHALDPTAALPPVVRSEISAVLAYICELMAKLSEAYCDTGIDYSVVMGGDADAFIRTLQRSDLLHELQNAVHSGRLTGEQIVEKIKVRSLPDV